MKSKEQLAEEYIETCQWSEFLYEDKSGMPWVEQKKRPSDIPSNIKLAFLAGFDACEKMYREASDEFDEKAQMKIQELKQCWNQEVAQSLKQEKQIQELEAEIQKILNERKD